jgi:hypothetical protein
MTRLANICSLNAAAETSGMALGAREKPVNDLWINWKIHAFVREICAK